MAGYGKVGDADTKTLVGSSSIVQTFSSRVLKIFRDADKDVGVSYDAANFTNTEDTIGRRAPTKKPGTLNFTKEGAFFSSVKLDSYVDKMQLKTFQIGTEVILYIDYGFHAINQSAEERDDPLFNSEGLTTIEFDVSSFLSDALVDRSTVVWDASLCTFVARIFGKIAEFVIPKITVSAKFQLDSGTKETDVGTVAIYGSVSVNGYFLYAGLHLDPPKWIGS